MVRAYGSVPVGIYAYGSGSNLSILGNHIHDIVTTVGSCNGNGGNAFGLAIYGTATTQWTNVTVSDNELDHLTLGCSESLSINGNVDGFVVSKNKVRDNDNIGIVAIGFEGTAPTPALDQARNGVISGNLVYNIASKNNPAYNGETSADGIYVDGDTRLLIERNVVHNADLGIELASEHSGMSSSYVLVRSNAIYFSNAAGISIGGYAANVGNAPAPASRPRRSSIQARRPTERFQSTSRLSPRSPRRSSTRAPRSRALRGGRAPPSGASRWRARSTSPAIRASPARGHRSRRLGAVAAAIERRGRDGALATPYQRVRRGVCTRSPGGEDRVDPMSRPEGVR